MTHSAPHVDPHPAEHWLMRRLKQFWPVIPLLGILFALMLSDLGDFMGYSPFGSNACSFADTPQSSVSAKMYLPLAKWALRYTPTPSVAIVYIDPAHDPPDLLTNTCASRAFLARLIPALNALSVHLIVIDKMYSANSCAEQDKTDALLAAVQNSKVPIVVGQATHALSNGTTSTGCLALTDKLDFKTPKALYGLIRLDSDDLKIPLRWPVFTDPADTGSSTPAVQPASTGAPPASAALPPDSGDSLSLVAAKAVNPNIESDPSVAKLLGAKPIIYPYTTFLNLPNITALTALCSGEPAQHAPIDGQPGAALCKPWTRPADNLDGKNLSLDSKIVIVGDLSDQDMKPFPTDLAPFPPGTRPGVFLHANYVQGLLDHRFLLEIPMPVTLGLMVLYVFIVYCLYWSHDKEGKAHLNAEQAGLWSLAVLAGLVLLSLLALVTMSYFTPLWALWGAGVLMVFRYLEASGHHRSQHLLGHIVSHRHPAAPTQAHEDSGPEKHS